MNLNKMIFLSTFIFMLLVPFENVNGNHEESLFIHFIDVGQADSILVQTLNGRTMLIDAGDNQDGKRVTAYLKKRGITRLDYLIATHPHHDHIGGMDSIIKSFTIGKLLMPEVSHDTKFYSDLIKAATQKGLHIEQAKEGKRFSLAPGISVHILSPDKSKYHLLNDYSAVIKVTHHKNKFLLMADAGFAVERQLLRKHKDIQADVLKIGHHGANTATSSSFLKKVNPDYAVVSVGKDNPYHYPDNEVLQRVNQRRIPMYRTDQIGSIIAKSNGKAISFTSQLKP
ncbi:ComEC/Rec2 family competence protein [Pseudalkalibacillus caeni]|nr:MBL fold metallo-hydrolase [Pseudalkalibacillus caeni]